jgi:soluble lytic murein transglycosylase
MSAQHPSGRSGSRKAPLPLGDDALPTELLPRLAGPIEAVTSFNPKAATQQEVPRSTVSVVPACRGAQRIPRMAKRLAGRDVLRTQVIPMGGRVTARPPKPLPKRLGHAPFVLAGLVAVFAARSTDVQAPAPVVVAEAAPAHVEAIDRVLLMRGANLPEPERRAVARAIAEESDRAGYDPFLILGLIDVESDFRRDALSPVGAHGLMQIMPDTLAWVARKAGVNLPATVIAKDPALCVRLGVRYLKQLHDQFHSIDLALMAYNAGPNKIAALAQERHGLDPYWGYVNAVHRERETLRAQETAIAVAQR